MKLDKLLGPPEKLIHAIIKPLTWVALVLLGLMVLHIVAHIFGRFLFRSPLVGTLEIIELETVILAACVVAYAEVQRRHVRVDVIFTKFPHLVQIRLAGIMNFIGAVYFVLMAWSAGKLAWTYLFPRIMASQNLYVPLAPFSFVLAFGILMLGLALLVNCFRPLPLQAGEKGEEK